VPHLEKHGCDADARAAAQAVLRYFDTSGVYHHQDEDQDLFPLLRARAAAQGAPEIAAAIEELEREHETMDAQWRRPAAAACSRSVEGEPRLAAEDVTRFAWLYRRHMDREGAAVLPFAREALDAAERAALGERMAARRGIKNLMKQSLKAGSSTRRACRSTSRAASASWERKGAVYATPRMVSDVEYTCREFLLEHLDPGEDSVGAHVSIDHLAPTPMGLAATIELAVAEVDRRKVVFTFSVKDPVEEVGRGRHVRFVVDTAKTRERLAAKRAKAGL
jgi:predicted thioesterase